MKSHQKTTAKPTAKGKKVQSKDLKISVKKVHQFLKTLTTAEYQYVKMSINVVEEIKHINEHYNVPHEEILNRLNIPLSKKEDFIKGSYEYDLHIIAGLHAMLSEQVLLTNTLQTNKTSK